MPTTSILPLDIEEAIIDVLAEDDKGHSALKKCSLVCRAFLPLCRKHIFHSIQLNGPKEYSESPLDGPILTPHILEKILAKSPEIARYIRELDYCVRKSDFTCPSIQETLRQISRLESLSVRHFSKKAPFYLDWSENPMRATLLHLLHLPSITHFKASSITNFVISDLIPCVNLKRLAFNRNLPANIAITNTTVFPAVLPEQSIQVNEFWSTHNRDINHESSGDIITKLCKAQRPDGKVIFEFNSLSKITIEFRTAKDEAVFQELFVRCKILTHVNFRFVEPRAVRPDIADMLRPSMSTLKHISITVYIEDEDDDPLFGITSDLEKMRSISIIETITVIVSVQINSECRYGDDWGRLDDVLTRSGWVALKRVSLVIGTIKLGMIDNQILALRKLPETQFRRLSGSRTVSFNFEVKN